MGHSNFHSFRRFFLFSPNPALIHSKLKEKLEESCDKFPRNIKIPKIDNNWHFLHLEFKYFISVGSMQNPFQAVPLMQP